jgi:hypothetical protein
VHKSPWTVHSNLKPTSLVFAGIKNGNGHYHVNCAGPKIMQPKVETKVNPKLSFYDSDCVSVGGNCSNGKNYGEELCMCMCMTLMVVSSWYTAVL